LTELSFATYGTPMLPKLCKSVHISTRETFFTIPFSLSPGTRSFGPFGRVSFSDLQTHVGVLWVIIPFSSFPQFSFFPVVVPRLFSEPVPFCPSRHTIASLHVPRSFSGFLPPRERRFLDFDSVLILPFPAITVPDCFCVLFYGLARFPFSHPP